MSDRQRTALVIGASTGIGAETARTLAQRGLAVRVLGRRAELLRELAAEVGGSADVLDVTSPEDVETVLARAAEELGGVDIAVYVAGMFEVSPVKNHPLELWEQTIAVNLTGAFLCARALFERLRPGGRIIFISSSTGRQGAPLMSAYSASKGGLERFAEALSGELQRRGVGVHVVAPGQVATPMLDRPGTSPFQLEPSQVAAVIGWLADLPGEVVVHDVEIHPVTTGPFAAARDVVPIASSNDQEGTH